MICVNIIINVGFVQTLIRLQILIMAARCLVPLLVMDNLFADHFCASFLTAIGLSVFLMMNYWKFMKKFFKTINSRR